LCYTIHCLLAVRLGGGTMVYRVAMVPFCDGKLTRWEGVPFPANMVSTTSELGNTSQRYGDPELAKANEGFALAALGLNGQRRFIPIKPIRHRRGEEGDWVKIAVAEKDVPSGSSVECDGLIFWGTTFSGVRSADCPPVAITESTGMLRALLHAGRNELELGVVREGVRAFGHSFQLKNDKIWTAVGPGIKRCCYRDSEKPSRVIDLDAEILTQLLEAGVPEDHIVISSHCTSCSRTIKYPSHRRSDELGQEVEPEARFTTFLY